jgi:hypothetical protein
VVKINGTPMPGWVDWEINNNTNYQADTFRVRFAFSALPQAAGPDWFASQSTIGVEILAGFPPDPTNFRETDLISWISGNVDDLEFDWPRAEVTLTGRDLTSVFIDTKTTEKFTEQTSSQIATTLAARHKLSTQYITATSTKVGTFYKKDMVLMQDQRSEWDLLTYLAGKEQFEVFVAGQALYFQPRPLASTTPYLLTWTYPGDNPTHIFNGTGLTLSRNLNVARGIVVVPTALFALPRQFRPE